MQIGSHCGVVFRLPDTQVYQPPKQKSKHSGKKKETHQHFLPVGYFVIVRKHSFLI